MLVEVKVGRNDAGQRAERYLRKHFFQMSLDRLQSLFRRKEIKIARKPIVRAHLLEEGDVIQIYGLRPEEATNSTAASPVSAKNSSAADVADSEGADPISRAARPFSIPILHEDADILVLDKPAGIAVHPGTGIDAGDSVIEKVWEYLASERTEGELFQPALVHRLDKDTSGVLVVAKSGNCLRRFTAAMRDGGFTKRYLALVEGAPKPATGEISGLLQRVDSKAGGAKSEVSEDDGKWSVTRYKTVKDFGKFSLLGVIIETGRMHQIRAHLAHVGHPLAGDPRYGSFERNREYRKSIGLKRTFLHASDLEVDLGKSGKLSFHSPLPKDLSKVLDRVSNPDSGMNPASGTHPVPGAR
jgi:23S rRNA pseudouridine955/2504/2580 synthase